MEVGVIVLSQCVSLNPIAFKKVWRLMTLLLAEDSRANIYKQNLATSNISYITFTYCLYTTNI